MSSGDTANFSETAMFVYSLNGKLILDKNFTQTISYKVKTAYLKLNYLSFYLLS